MTEGRIFMNQKSLTALEEYLNKVYVIVVLILPVACQCAGLVYTFEKLFGWLPTVSWVALIVFDITCLIYLAVGIYFVKTGFKDGRVNPVKMRHVKIYVVIVILIQFNFILYMIPSSDFWGFAFFFVILPAFLLDTKVVMASDIVILLSLAVSWIVRSDELLPVRDKMFIANMVNRSVCTLLSLPTLWLFSFMISYFLVNAKKDEMERNNERVENVLKHVVNITKELSETSASLVDTSQTESASTQELSAISESLLESSAGMGKMAQSSKDNLSQLYECNENVNAEMQTVDNFSKELMDISKTNEQSLNKLMKVSGEVEQSTEQMSEVTQKLVNESAEIAKTLDIINDIANSINLLALNASIEAARAGESGRGFAVVATEVGNLADSTKDTLQTVSGIVSRVQDGTNAVSGIMESNTRKLLEQSHVIEETVNGIRNMIDLLKQSAAAITSTDEIQKKQNRILKETVSINEQLADGIQTENKEFENITQMVQSNTEQIMILSSQVESINEMIRELEGLLQ